MGRDWPVMSANRKLRTADLADVSVSGLPVIRPRGLVLSTWAVRWRFDRPRQPEVVGSRFQSLMTLSQKREIGPQVDGTVVAVLGSEFRTGRGRRDYL